ncbi:hypothetical protein SALBM311S_01589 [Streptomyces alboniger]
MEATALSGHPGQQPHLVAGAGAQPVVPAAGGVVLDEVRPLGAVLGDGAGQAGELGDGRVLAPHRADLKRSAWATDERQRKMAYSKQETAGAPTCCHAAR